MSAAIVIGWLINLLPNRFKNIGWGAIFLALIFNLINTSVFMREFTQTLNPTLEKWIREASQAQRPIRHIGEPWTPIFWAHVYGAEILSGDTSWAERNETTGAVLIFDGTAPATLTREKYQIEYIESNRLVDAIYPVLTQEALIPRRLERWLPLEAAKPLANIPQTGVIYHYAPGSCMTPPLFGNGTLHYYQLLFAKLTQAVVPR
jgi:hypothetical protein